MYKNSMQMQGKIYLHSHFWMPCKCMKFKYLRIRMGAAAMWRNIYKRPERKAAESVLHFNAEAFCMGEASTSNRTHHKRQKPTRSEPSERTKRANQGRKGQKAPFILLFLFPWHLVRWQIPKCFCRNGGNWQKQHQPRARRIVPLLERLTRWQSFQVMKGTCSHCLRV